MMRYMTAGESHGKMLVGILEGIPAGLELSFDAVDAELSRRQQGYGRGGRMSIERDRAEIVSGVRNSVTTGAPIAVLIKNADYQNWADVMDTRVCDTEKKTVTAPRPGHADYVGCKKFGFTDARNILERTSARNTASVVALGAIAKQLLGALGVRIASYVTQIGCAVETAAYGSAEEIFDIAERSAVRALSARAEWDMIAEIDRAAAQSDTVGGRFRVVADGLKAGVGSCMEPAEKLDYLLMGAIGGLQGVKAVQIGDAECYVESLGTEAHDAIYTDRSGRVFRKTNRAGGIEGGMSNGEQLVLTATFKPIPTTMKGLETVDLKTKKAAVSSKERSDICAVPAAGVVSENLAALTLAGAVLHKTGGSTISEVIKAWNA